MKAQEVLNHPLVAAKIAALKAATETEGTFSRQAKRELLARDIRGEISLMDGRRKFIEIDNKLAGHNEPEPIQVVGVFGLMAQIRKSAPKP